MPVRLTAALAALAVPAVLLTSVALAQEPPPVPAETPAPQAQPASPPDPKAVLESACTSCHGLDFIADHRKTRDGWDFTVRVMVDRGADLDPDTAALVVDYLAKTYPADPAPDAPKPDKPPN